MMLSALHPPFDMSHLFALLLALCCAISQAATITGKVVAVADCDTITVLDANKVQHRKNYAQR